MRYSIPILILLLVLTGCASQKFIASKGVFYPQDETRELDALTRFNIPTMEGVAGNLFTAGDMQFLDDRAFLPVTVSSKSGAEMYSYSVIYALDADTAAVLDSLVLKPDEYMKFFALVAEQDLFIVGEQDTLLHIIKTDKYLNIIQRFPIEFSYERIFYAGTAHDKLRIVVSDKQNKLLMHEFRLEDLTLERSRLLAKKHENNYKHVIQDDILWVLNLEGNLLSTVRYNLSAMDPNPERKEFLFPADALSNYTAEISSVADNFIYLTYWEKDDPKDAEKITEIKIITLDYDKETATDKSFAAFPTDYFVQAADGRIYFYEAQVDPKKALTTYTISEATADLKELSPIIRFLETDRKVRFYAMDESVFKLNDNDGKLYLTGLYYQNLGKFRAGDEALYISRDGYKWQPQLFLGVLTPEQETER